MIFGGFVLAFVSGVVAGYVGVRVYDKNNGRKEAFSAYWKKLHDRDSSTRS
jgi:hypothetical protein